MSATHTPIGSRLGVAGVYLLWRGRRVVYAGQSKNMLRRLGQHAVQKDFDEVTTIPCGEYRRPLESYAVRKLKPEQNYNIRGALEDQYPYTPATHAWLLAELPAAVELIDNIADAIDLT